MIGSISFQGRHWATMEDNGYWAAEDIDLSTLLNKNFSPHDEKFTGTGFNHTGWGSDCVATAAEELSCEAKYPETKSLPDGAIY